MFADSLRCLIRPLLKVWVQARYLAILSILFRQIWHPAEKAKTHIGGQVQCLAIADALEETASREVGDANVPKANVRNVL